MKCIMKKKSFTLALILACLALMGSGWGQAGSLEPSGPPSPTMKTLDQVQPRIPVQFLGGTATALYSIDRPGSYYLTADILGSSGMNGIEIHAPNVVLDLNGFGVIGVPGSWNGVVTDLDLPNIAVRNGTVKGWDQMGVWNRSFNGEISEVMASENGVSGIRLRGGLISRCTTNYNFTHGIFLEEVGGLVVDSQSSGNWDTGIFIEWRGLVENCVAADQSIGVDAAWEDVQVIDSTLANNGVGVRVYQASLIRGNQFVENGWGVQVRDDGQANRIEDNTFEAGDTGVRIDSGAQGNFLARNAAHRCATTAYDIPAGNSYGPIIDATGAGDLSAVPGADHPWANFLY